MVFRRLVRALRRGGVLTLLFVVATMACGFAITQLTTPAYESTSRVVVTSTEGGNGAGGFVSEQRTATYVEIVNSSLMADRVIEELSPQLEREPSAQDLVEHVSARVVDESAVVEITFADGDAERAQLFAQAYADELVRAAADIETPENGESRLTRISVIDRATFQPDAVTPRPILNLVVSVLFGLLIGLGAAALREFLDTSINSSEDLAKFTDVPVIGTIPHESSLTRKRLMTELDHDSPRVEAFRVLRTNVQFLDIDSPNKVFVVTSPLKNEGKTSTAVNLAITLARAGTRTLLIDADLRRPEIAQIFDTDGSAGVTTVLLGKVQLADAVWRHEASGLDVLPSGVVPPNAVELLQTRAMGALLDRVRADYEVVLIDSPPLLPVTDAALLAARADGTILVVRHGKTRKDQIALAMERLAAVGIVPAGAVLTRIPVDRNHVNYYGSYDARPSKA